MWEKLEALDRDLEATCDMISVGHMGSTSKCLWENNDNVSALISNANGFKHFFNKVQLLRV